MKDFFFSFTMVLILSFVVSCSVDISPSADASLCRLCDNSFRVTQEELMFLLGEKMNSPTRTDASRIEPLSFRGDTVLYLAQNKKGWKLFSADKRTCAIFAYSDEEPWSDELFEKNPAFAKWFETQCETVLTLRRSGSQDCEINEFWRYLPQAMSETRSGPDGLEGPGWRLIHTSDSLAVYDDIPPIIITKWGREEPWNSCTPYTGLSAPYERCSVGCVNVAFGQVLYWAHSALGMPQYMYTVASCNDTINNSGVYYFAFTDSSTTAWPQMKLRQNMSGSADYSSNLMAKVSRLTNTDYGYKYESGLPNRFAVTAFDSSITNSVCYYFGLTADYASYTKERVITSLRAGSPVIISSRVSPDELIGHSWIIDGYTHYYELHRLYYIWDPEESYEPSGEDDQEEQELDENNMGPDTFILPEGYPYQIIEYPFSDEYYRMNWGEDGVGDSVYYNVNAIGWENDGEAPYLKSLAKIAYNFCLLYSL